MYSEHISGDQNKELSHKSFIFLFFRLFYIYGRWHANLTYFSKKIAGNLFFLIKLSEFGQRILKFKIRQNNGHPNIYIYIFFSNDHLN